MYTHGDTSSALLPIKFSLIFAQNVLVYVILMSKEDYTYGEIGQTWTADDKDSANVILFLGCCLIWGLCYFEMLMMIVGTSVPFVFAKFNLLQIVLHLIGCLFTVWFILDTWNYMRIWNIFVVCSVLPFILEIIMMRQAVKLKIDISKN